MEEVPAKEGKENEIGSKEDLEMKLARIEEEVTKYTAEVAKEKEDQEKERRRSERKKKRRNTGR